MNFLTPSEHSPFTTQMNRSRISMMMLIEIPFVSSCWMSSSFSTEQSGKICSSWKTFSFAFVVIIPIWNWFNFVSSSHYVPFKLIPTRKIRKRNSLEHEKTFHPPKASLFRNKIFETFQCLRLRLMFTLEKKIFFFNIQVFAFIRIIDSIFISSCLIGWENRKIDFPFNNLIFHIEGL